MKTDAVGQIYFPIVNLSNCSADRLLYIDRSDYLQPDGFVNICINDRYRVEHISGDEYDLEDVEKEPDNYRFRMKIKKM